jgi:hypothetical protein
MPGPYVLIQLDYETFHRERDRLGLRRYPVRDALNSATELDPADPAVFPRYPPWVDQQALRLASQVRRTIVGQLHPALSKRIFHLRSSKNLNTTVELSWQIQSGAGFDPDQHAAFQAIAGEGDGTVPAWSARLTQVPDSHVGELSEASDHPFMLRECETLRAIDHIVLHGRVPTPSAAIAAPSAPRSPARSQQVLRDVKALRVQPGDPVLADPAVWEPLIR